MPSIYKLQILLFMICFAFLTFASAAVPKIHSERVLFSKGANGTVIKKRIKGDETVDYTLRAKADQRMMVVLKTNNASNYFNIMAPGVTKALHIGSTVGNRFEAKLPTDGDYTIRVYLMRNAARRNESATYALSVNIFNSTASSVAAPANDFADGFGGGPDFWQVAGVKNGDSLNLWSEPSIKSKAIAELTNGNLLRNQGCKPLEGQRWCKVAQVDGNKLSGWVVGRFLQEAARPVSDAAVSSSEVTGNGQPFHATGHILCSLDASQPSSNCAFGVIRQDRGNAGVWVKLNGRGERHILFESGKPVSSNSTAVLSFEKSADLYLIRIGEERYEIPEAVVFGG